MSERFVVRDKRTLKVLATYDHLAELREAWFVRRGDLWEAKADVIATTQGSMADALFEMMSDTEAGE